MIRKTRKPNQKPISGDRTRDSSTLTMPVTWPLASCAKPQTTWSVPTETTTAPIRPPTSACDDDDGMPSHQVPRFQTMAPIRPQSRIDSEISGATSSSVTNLPIVLATAVPPSNGPRNSKVPTITTAWTGVIARDAMTVATMLAASWKPLV